jgi:hypothetical protein
MPDSEDLSPIIFALDSLGDVPEVRNTELCGVNVPLSGAADVTGYK